MQGVNMKPILFFVCGLVLATFCSGCALEEVRGKNKLGVEWRHIASRTQSDERYTVEPGFEFKWEKGVTTGVSYRNRSTNEGRGDDDNGLFVDFSFPIWKRPKVDKTTDRIEALEQRLTELEAERSEALRH